MNSAVRTKFSFFHRKQDVSEAERPIKESATGIFNDETFRIG